MAWRDKRRLAMLGLVALAAAPAFAQVRMPAFVGGVPGAASKQSIERQRHQERTFLYREAIEELRRNPKVVDVVECAAGAPETSLCLPPPPPPSPAPAAAGGEGRRLALVVGNNRYRPPIPLLETPARDAERVGELLRTRFGFEVRALRDAEKADIVGAVAKLARETGAADSVVVYYAGHGYLMDDTGMGYWIPVDGSVKTAAQWLSNTDIAKLLRAIPARQLILISDSCFSGSLAREQTLSEASASREARRRSVLVLASGGEEPVADEGKDGHSVFAFHLLRALAAIDGTMPGYEVYRGVRRGVSEDYPQTPQYGAVVSAGHEAGGEYLFETRRP